MSRAALALAVLAVAAVAVGLAALLAGAGDGADGPAGGAAWARAPRVVIPPSLPGDRVLYGRLRNDGPRTVTLKVAALHVVDGAGRALKSDARFLPAFAPGGAAVTLAPGRTAPLTVAWRGAGARRVSIGAVTLPIP